MEPKNKDERTKAFINFLLLFILSIVIIVTTVFFSVRVPFSENEKFRARIEAIDREKAFTNKFTTQMIEISRMLDTINRTSPQEAIRLEGTIETGLTKLNGLVSDTIFNKDLYVNVVHNLGDLQQYLKEIRSKSDNDLDVNNYKAQLEKANEKAQDLYKQYIECLTKK